MRGALASAVVAVALAVALLVTPGTAPADTAEAAVATHQLALGLSALPFDDMSNLDAHTAAYGRQPAIWSVWSDWGRANGAFPTALLNGLRARGVVPMIFWEPVIPGSPDFLWADLLTGKYDAYIRSYAQAAKNWGGAIILRFAHEMDGVWFPWGSGHGTNTPANFVAGWRHVWNIFRGPGGVGATNVKFLWSPNVAKAEYFPGNAYVDYVGFSAFNWAKHGNWYPMGTLLNIRAGRMRKITKKPEIVAELGSNSIGGDKAAWLTNGYATAYTKYPYIVAIIYFDVNMQPEGQPDWRLTTPSGATTAYGNLLKKPINQGTLVSPRVVASLPASVVTTTADATSVNLTLTANDFGGAGIQRWYVSTSPTRPLRTDPNWTLTPPTSITLPAGLGTKTVYAWVEDSNGIISPTAQASTIRKASTTASVSSDVNPSTFGDGVTFTATITSAVGTVGDGMVEFKSDGTDIVGCAARPVSAGSATCGPISGLTAGTRPITAYFSGGTNFANSDNSASVYNQTLKRATTTTGVSSDIHPSTFGQGVTFTATISSTAGTIGGGTVTFKSDGANIAGCVGRPVSAGSATCGPISNLPADLHPPPNNPHAITAYFSGSTNFLASDNSTSTWSQTVNKASTTTSVSSNIHPSTFGQGVTFTATIGSGGGTPGAGTVEFKAGGADIPGCTAQPVSSGQATCGPISDFDVANSPHVITAYFSGNTNFLASDNSASTWPQTVNKASTTTSVGSDGNPSTFGDGVTFTATISSTGGTVGDGTVKFKSDGTDIASCTAQPVSSGLATCSAISDLAAGAHLITAYFSGSTNFADSDNSTLAYSQTVDQAATTTSVGSDVNPSTFGDGVTFTATISWAGGTVGDGTVEFKSDGTDIPGCTGQPVSSGQATCGPISDLSADPPGTHEITAYFIGTTNFNASDNSASAYIQTVNPAP